MTDYAKRFAAVKKAAEPRNDHYTPYQKHGSWWYDDGGIAHGPFISERGCLDAAERQQERDEE